MKVYFAADHAGFDLKAQLIAYVKTLSNASVTYETADCGAFEFDQADDYPDFIGRAGELLATDAANGVESRAVVLGASGQGEAMAMNRFRGVRCALYYAEPGKSQTDVTGQTLDIIEGTREHNNANALSLAARFLSADEAKQVVGKWLISGFGGAERNLRRIKKLDTLGA